MASINTVIYGLLRDSVHPEVIVFADQNAPRPNSPFWTIRVQSHRAIGRDYYGQGVTVDGDQQIDGVREATVNVQRIGDDSDIRVADFRDSLSKTTVIDRWKINDIAIYRIGDVKNIPQLLDNKQFEPRASIDLFVRFGSKIMDRVGIIEKLNLTGEYETVNLAQNIDVVLN